MQHLRLCGVFALARLGPAVETAPTEAFGERPVRIVLEMRCERTRSESVHLAEAVLRQLRPRDSLALALFRLQNRHSRAYSEKVAVAGANNYVRSASLDT